MEIVRAERINGLVAVGGGSTTWLAKAIAYRTDLPQIIGSTTFAGSEMTPILGQTEGYDRQPSNTAAVLVST
ncbi:hypothetical protein LMG28138_05881 [Pararobbsia alpina]|uniref:Alcohol dehydrogenase iron-type/glycerol dehydrogenase GldA domain-containing protein n=2 Tax=Pararobbsia alpina TaxID=621374 RepID=A0A6S7BPX9_9BURK|nr:hypothetical protein LMG28138_05881 [Pararobbsia alpina]